VSRGPDFRDLVGDELSPDEEARLRRAHDLLVAAGPPPELPQKLAEPPTPQGQLVSLAQKRLRTGLVLAAALVLAAFALGYLIGAGNDGSGSGFEPVQTAVLGKSGGRLAVVRIGHTDDNGNTPMLVTLEGLDHLPDGDYYTLFMTRGGKPIATCGTFNVDDDKTTSVRLNVGYEIDRFDGLMLAEWRRDTRADKPLLRAPLSG
jgi:hypothetical protein